MGEWRGAVSWTVSAGRCEGGGTSSDADLSPQAPGAGAGRMIALSAYGGLFLVAFIAATLLPAQSEATLVGLLASRTFSPWALIAVASTGNVLGSVVNWWLGLYMERFKGRRWFPVSDKSLAKAQAWYARHGRWSLLLSWAPVIGDPITVAAGVMREPFWPFVILVGIAKTTRYLVISAAFLGLGF